MKKTLAILAAVLMVLGFSGGAGAAGVYEYYDGYQFVGEGQTYDFFFDLIYTNDVFGPTPGTTAGGMSLANDVAMYSDFYALASTEATYVSVDLYSTDWEAEIASIELTAYYDGGEYELYNGLFNGLDFFGLTDTTVNFMFDISDTSFVSDPWGNITIGAAITYWGNVDNDFAITEVGVGVPEPATMLLLGTGLVGLAVSSRKKFFKK